GASLAAAVAISVTFVFRALTVAFNWRTSPVADPGETDVHP
ncbi:MAG: trimeric intracellular cation channel family protein, partial [Opitutaceae bacterium]|nr:trimeric intracellular cation channel family protein [Opitutaceae bacterium]